MKKYSYQSSIRTPEEVRDCMSRVCETIILMKMITLEKV